METGNQQTKRTRLIVDISPDLRRRIKIAAAKDDRSIKDYIEHILEQAVPADASQSERVRRPVTREAFESLMETREAIKRAHPGVAFGDSAEDLRQMRQERSEYQDQL